VGGRREEKTLGDFDLAVAKHTKTYIACLHDQNKSVFLKGRLLSSQSEQFEKFSKSPNWLEKSRPSKKATYVFIM